MCLKVPDDANTEEIAAITAAVRVHLAASETDEKKTNESWRGRRWKFTARFQPDTGRIRVSAPTDPWTASGRTNRL